jgi:hypothetical protein
VQAWNAKAWETLASMLRRGNWERNGHLSNIVYGMIDM